MIGSPPSPDAAAAPSSVKTSRSRRRIGLALATVLGLALAAWLVRAIGWRSILAAAHTLGAGGFGLFCLYSVGLSLLLGAACLVPSGEGWRRLPLFTLARMAREAAADFLPLSQLGGLAVGAHVATAGGVPRRRVIAAMICDQATEIGSQLVFTVMGVAIAGPLLLAGDAVGLRGALAVSALVTLAMLAAMIHGQRPVLRLGARFAATLMPAASGLLLEVEKELARIYAGRLRVAASFVLNLAAWLATAGASWLALRLMGHPLPFWRLVAIESIISAIRSAAFLVPGAIGLQEAAYVVVGPVLGLAAGPALALSIVKRARDAVLALVGVAGWWLVGGRSLLTAHNAQATGLPETGRASAVR